MLQHPLHGSCLCEWSSKHHFALGSRHKCLQIGTGQRLAEWIKVLPCHGWLDREEVTGYAPPVSTCVHGCIATDTFRLFVFVARPCLEEQLEPFACVL